jgi:hypothetical protein
MRQHGLGEDQTLGTYRRLTKPGAASEVVVIVFALAVFGVAWTCVHLLAVLDWGFGVERAVLLALVFVSVIMFMTLLAGQVSALRRRCAAATLGLVAAIEAWFFLRSPQSIPGWQTVATVIFAMLPALLWVPIGLRLRARSLLVVFLVLACTGLLVRRCVDFERCKRNPHLTDIAEATMAAGERILKGEEVYVHIKEGPADDASMKASYRGFVYNPMMAIAYLPLGHCFGARGVLFTNLVLDLAAAMLIFLIGSQLGTIAGGLCGLCVYLMLPLVPFELYVQGVTDLAAVVPLIAGLALFRRYPSWAGLCIGLSISVKLFPGAFLLLCFAQRGQLRRYTVGVALGLVPTLCFLALGPSAFVESTLLFCLQRTSDSTSWLHGLPNAVQTVAGVLSLVFLIGSGGLLCWWQGVATRRCAFSILIIIGSLLSAPVVHRNYMLWWLPFFAVFCGFAMERLLLSEPVRSESPSVSRD